MPTLYLIPTVLADNTADQVLSPQIRDVISKLDAYFVENVRTARRFISSLKTGKVIDELSFFDLNKDTTDIDVRRNMQALTDRKQDAGVLSEAGCPGVADPGAAAVRVAHQLGWTVVPLVGPSSILMALMASGMSGQSFVFHGYLPIDRGERSKTLKQLEKEARLKQQTQIFMETPYRNNQLMGDVLSACAGDSRLCVACNVTAPDAFIKTKTIKDWKGQLPDLHKKPTVFLLF
ncbi:SAM-dependent methyltransferase [Arsenicibacter rosenii]|uniref:SAM-dependent methyltransferase n=1 Tax=Arsenicibacter rosenii TaxID=1750698 RepID=A0A1S2VPX9_9BACT|nr:SAM-dependent methyltransferase [Arsenicibacter rosenii]OIN60833.1 SAM-dependent methyltransferase [Arsenicibacter rosenii]